MALANRSVEDKVLHFDSKGRSNMAEKQLSKIPSDAFLYLAAGSIIGSLTLKYLGKEEDSLFVGQWAPTFAILGVFDKIVRALK